MTTGIIQTLWDRGIDFMARDRQSEDVERTRTAERTTPVATGIITAIRDRGFGFIGRDEPGDRTDVFFHRSAVAGDGFDQLREGQHVSFDEEPDPRDRTRQRAVNVQPAAAGDRE